MRLRTRRLTRTVAATALATASLVALPGRAAADTPPTAYSASLYTATTGSVVPTVSLGGPVGGLLNALVGPILNGLTQPLVAAVTALPGVLLYGTDDSPGLVDALSVNANSVAAHSGPPPTASCAGWNDSSAPRDCYHLLPAPLALDPLLHLDLGVAGGYTSTDTSASGKPATAEADIAELGLSLLGIPLIGTGAVKATAQCPTTGGRAPTASVGVVGGGSPLQLLPGLLSGALQVSVADPATGLLDVIGANVPGLQITNPLGAGTLPVSVAVNGNLVTLSIGLGLKDLLNGLGVPVLGSLLSSVVDTDIHLTVVLGPGSSSDGEHNAEAWGLRLAVSLSLHLKIDLGLASVNVDLSNGPLLDLRLGYARCSTSGSGTGDGGTPFIPPALI